jgi:L-fuconate dehydratase
MIDYLCVSGSLDGRMVEHAAHLHEHFRDPIRVERGRYRAPTAPGFSAEMKARSISEHLFPDGAAWRDRAA